MMCVLSMIVWRRWAIVKTVHSSKVWRIAFCRIASVSLSIDAVASSNTSTALAQRAARLPAQQLALPHREVGAALGDDVLQPVLEAVDDVRELDELQHAAELGLRVRAERVEVVPHRLVEARGPAG